MNQSTPTTKTKWLTILLTMILAGSFLWQITQFAAFAQSDDPCQKNIILLIDNSQSITDGNDGADSTDIGQLRIRIARFLVNYLNMIGDTNTCIGVITFAGSATPRVPLTPVNNWRNGDFNAIASENEGGVTNFVSALEAARLMIVPSGNIDDLDVSHEHEILMLTDGNLDEFDIRHYSQGGYETAIKQQLDILSTTIQLRLVTFDDKNSETWQQFVGSDEEYYLPVQEMLPNEVYVKILQTLTNDNALDEFEPFIIPGHAIATFTMLPYRDWMRLSTLSDNPVTVTFLLNNEELEPIVTGQEYFFFQPPAGEWEMHFNTVDEALMFAKIETGSSNFQVSLHPIGVKSVESSVLVEASLTAGTYSIAPTNDFIITAVFTGSDGSTSKPYDLSPDPSDGTYKTLIPIGDLVTSTYDVFLDMSGQGEAWSDVHVTQYVSGAFTLLQLPSISSIDIEPSNPIQGKPVTVTVNVKNWRSLITQSLQLDILNTLGQTITQGIRVNGHAGVFQTEFQGTEDVGVYQVSVFIPSQNINGQLGDIAYSKYLIIEDQLPEVELTPVPDVNNTSSAKDTGRLGHTGAMRNFDVGASLGVIGYFLVVLIVATFLLISRWSAKPTASKAAELAKMNARKSNKPEIAKKKVEISKELHRNVQELLRKSFKDPTVIRLMAIGGYFYDSIWITDRSGTEDTIHTGTEDTIHIFSTLTAVTFAESWQENPQVGFDLLGTIVLSDDDNKGKGKYKRQRFLSMIENYGKIDKDVLPCIRFFNYWINEREEINASSISQLLDEALGDGDETRKLTGLQKFDHLKMGTEWVNLFQTFKNILSSCNIGEAQNCVKDMLESPPLIFSEMGHLKNALEKMRDYDGTTEAQEGLNDSIDRLSSFYQDIIRETFMKHLP